MKTTLEPKAQTVQLIPLSKIKFAPWNPKSRIDEKRLERLAESINDIGLVYPVVLDENYQLVDGHRRCTVASGMRWKHIPAIMISSEFLHSYGSLNANQERMSGNDLLGVYLDNPGALIRRQQLKILRIEKVCGMESVRLLYKAKMSARTFDIAIRVVRYLEGEVEASAVLRWLVKHSLTSKMWGLVRAGISPKILKRAIEADEPLKIKVTAE